MTLGLDHTPELLFSLRSIAALTCGFVLSKCLNRACALGWELAMSRLFFAVGLQDRPY